MCICTYVHACIHTQVYKHIYTSIYNTSIVTSVMSEIIPSVVVSGITNEYTCIYIYIHVCIAHVYLRIYVSHDGTPACTPISACQCFAKCDAFCALSSKQFVAQACAKGYEGLPPLLGISANGGFHESIFEFPHRNSPAMWGLYAKPHINMFLCLCIYMYLYL